MNLTEANALATELGGRAPGHLIKADDWNSLVSILEAYGLTLLGLDTRVAALETGVAQLTTQVAELVDIPARMQVLEDETAPLRENYLLSVRTTAEHYLVGEVAELVFRASALDGSALSGTMPWLDLVTTWGRLRAAPGVVVRDNAEENALSVQFNNAGEVRVQLRSHFTRGFQASEEQSFARVLQTQAGTSGKTVMKVLQDSASPQDPETVLAFKAIHAVYDGNQTIKGYADKYVGQYSGGRYGGDKLGELMVRGEWEHYRATVMAFAKPDASALTPDPTRGIATIQVSFREWIPHWSVDYVDSFTPVLPAWKDLFELNLERLELLPRVLEELDRKRATSGVLGNLRNLKAMEKAATLINPGADPIKQYGKTMLEGVVKTQLAAGGADNLAASGYADQAQVTQQVSQQAKTALSTARDAASAKQAIGVLEARIQAAEQTGKEINAGLRTIGDGVNKINVAEVADLGGRLNKINLDIAGLANKINR